MCARNIVLSSESGDTPIRAKVRERIFVLDIVYLLLGRKVSMRLIGWKNCFAGI